MSRATANVLDKPYFDPPKVPIDSWGHPYVYEFPGKHNPESYDLYSLGPDQKAGTDDDIGIGNR